MSARYSYENSHAPQILGGRFFKADGPQPRADEIAALLPDFKKWLLAAAAKMPTTVDLNLDLLYSNNNLSVSSRCMKTRMPEGVSLLSGSQIQAQKTQQLNRCNNDYQQALSGFNRCEGYRADLQRAEQQLQEAEASQCGQDESESAAEASSVADSGDSICDFPADMTVADLSTELKQCMMDKCGTPSAANIAQFQQCAQQIQVEAQTHIQRLMGVTRNQSQKAKKATDTCKVANNALRNARQSLQGAHCDDYVAQPEAVDCSAQVNVETPEFYPIERFQFAELGSCSWQSSLSMQHKNSAWLLPNQKPDRELARHVDLALQQTLSLPFKPDGITLNPLGQTAATGKVKVELLGLDRQQSSGASLVLNAKVISSEVVAR